MGNNNYLEASNLVFYGTMIVNGEGFGIVIRTGDKTVIGSIADLAVNEEKRPSQLSQEIDLFVKKMAGKQSSSMPKASDCHYVCCHLFHFRYGSRSKQIFNELCFRYWCFSSFCSLARQKL